MQQSGFITFTDPGDWTADDEDMDGGAITNGFYIAIQRTYAPVVAVLPVESFFKTFISLAGDTGMYIGGDGIIKLPYLTGAPAVPVNGMAWFEADGLHIYYNAAEKVVAGA